MKKYFIKMVIVLLSVVNSRLDASAPAPAVTEYKKELLIQIGKAVDVDLSGCASPRDAVRDLTGGDFTKDSSVDLVDMTDSVPYVQDLVRGIEVLQNQFGVDDAFLDGKTSIKQRLAAIEVKILSRKMRK